MPIRNFTPNWKFLELEDVPGSFQSLIGGSSLLAQTLYRRGITTPEQACGFLDPSLYHPCPAKDLPGVADAADRIHKAIAQQETILVWGDFDVDGQTSTALLSAAFSELGSRVFHYIPNRSQESHGITPQSLQANIDLLQPGLIVTCDTGIDATDAAALSHRSGIDLIVTDHHQLPVQLPAAFAIVNPVFLPAGHPLSALPGVGVAYKLIEELFSRVGSSPKKLLDLVALGIVADVAPIYKDTRYLLQMGLEVLRSTPRLGLQKLFENAKIDAANITEDTISYAIGPRLNALGRLADANSCVDFFTSNDSAIITPLAAQLEELNQYRQTLTERVFQESLVKIDSDPTLVSNYPVLVLDGSSWHPGIIGIVASRLVERFHKPVIMLTKEGNQARGSARSIPGIPISDLIGQTSELLTSYGGHPMAAGLSLEVSNISDFRTNLADKYHTTLGDVIISPEITIDAELPFQSLNAGIVAELGRLAPFGPDNLRLLFATRNVTVAADRTIGKNGVHRKLTLSDSSGYKVDLLWWNSVGVDLPRGSFDVAYTLDLSSFKDQLQLQITLRHFRETSDAPVYIQTTQGPILIDYRQSSEPLKDLSGLVSSLDDYQLWAEYSLPAGIPSVPRLSLSPSADLILWSIPPSPFVFKSLLEKVSPERVYLFAVDPQLRVSKLFIRKALKGLLLHLQNHPEKGFQAELFAQRIASTTVLVEIGLDWLHCHGDYDLTDLRDRNLVRPGTGETLPCFQDVDAKLAIALSEISAYRSYFKRANIKSLL